MVATTFDSIIGIALPILIILFMFVAIMGKIREPLRAFWEWIKGLFGAGIEKVQEAPSVLDVRAGNIIYR